LLGVDPGILRTRGAVSRETAEAMAAGVMRLTGTDYSLAVTGIAGPKGGSRDKPVGTVWMAVAWNGGIRSFSRLFTGDRNEVRSSAAEHLLIHLAELLEESEK